MYKKVEFRGHSFYISSDEWTDCEEFLLEIYIGREWAWLFDYPGYNGAYTINIGDNVSRWDWVNHPLSIAKTVKGRKILADISNNLEEYKRFFLKEILKAKL